MITEPPDCRLIQTFTVFRQSTEGNEPIPCSLGRVMNNKKRRFKYQMRVQYLGTRYFGWQIQKDRPTIQAILTETLLRITGERPSVVGAGRTDSGVHAIWQVAHFTLTRNLSSHRLVNSLNGILPSDIRVVNLRRAPLDFHAQRKALRKRYLYRIYNGSVLSPFLDGRVYHLRRKLDALAMQEASRLFHGTHDFSGFAAASTRTKSRVRTVYRSVVQQRGHHLAFVVEADGFLHHMVRNMVGTLIEVGRGRREAADIARIIDSRDRRTAGPTAPAQGLFLARIWYSSSSFPGSSGL